MKILSAIGLFLVTMSAFAADRTTAPQDATLYIISPHNGEAVSNPVVVRFGLKGMGVAPAGVEKANTGHHHLLIDAEVPSLDEPIAKDEHHRHFGGGQTEAVLNLSPGEHTLRLILGDHRHMPHDPALISEPVTIMVTE